jgi:Domain of unknown function (DUF5916)
MHAATKELVCGLVAFGVALLLPAVASAAEANGSFVMHAAALPSPPPMDGSVAEHWQGSAHADLTWEFNLDKPAHEKTDVYLGIDAHYLYVAFDAEQHEQITATQASNNVGDGSDDEVQVYVWPSGANGFVYTFSATPRGTRYQYSSENNNFAPIWDAVGAIRPNGYAVTMRIPFSAMRGDGRGEWCIQFARQVHVSHEVFEWSHASGQQAPGQTVYAGHLDGVGAVAKAARTKPRIGVYGLASAASQSAGGATSRAGVDLAIPLTATSSLVATFHPDFSNVEVDQQSIAPSAFQHYLNETRPFFSQGTNTFGTNCYGCPGINELYTPNIPTPRRGFALEGTQGQLTFDAYSALGDDRIDTGQALVYLTPNHVWQFDYNRISADLTDTLHDVTQVASVGYNDHKRWIGYFDYGWDRGTNVLDATQAQRYDGGFAYNTKNDFDAFTMRKIGEFYNPYDGFMTLTDLSGYSAQLNKNFPFAQGKPIQTVGVSLFRDSYVGTTGGLDLADANFSVTVTTKSRFLFGANTGSSYVRNPGDILRPFNQNGAVIEYAPGTPTQSTLSFNTGAYGAGRLNSWQRIVGFGVAHKTTVSLEADDTDYVQPGTTAVQWLERASASFAIGPDTSFAAGVRKIFGRAPLYGYQQPNGTNLSLSFSKRRAHDEFFVVYGDAAATSTVPQLIFKYVYYLGAQKGT